MVLSANPLAVDPARLRELRVGELLLGGRPYVPGQSLAGALRRALGNRGARV